MTSDNLTEAVSPGDLILVHASKAIMLTVKSAPDTPNPQTSSIVVQEVECHIPRQQGYWIMDGPKVEMVEGIESEECFCRGSHENDKPETTLKECLDAATGQEIQIFVRPHGRDVLKYYFNGACPECGGRSWSCPGCGGYGIRFPDIFGSCGRDQSCPVCLGHEFALEDKQTHRDLETLSSKRSAPVLSVDEKMQIREEILSTKRNRYELINARKQEMGMPTEDIDKLIQDAERCLDEFP
ncbi:hypothetical protein ASPZODRAFT_131386 [Penicilliopsis zonata CBS 506.65]|uniref:Uncharacterized protein n=1 Tax=Penicilliopsis zonata CBS 506.65 TaxID=1073090 RepID=A0A1L9SL11_9EURO|nr:hypothetical protein ASPZODRAFT_131386 [Penicilliopsis zonata CBS 506.65]OJJ47806.1 hypothetical protein ASPZODRAFT_131386 [Penicilliopsis zonata CBS 506.65]